MKSTLRSILARPTAISFAAVFVICVQVSTVLAAQTVTVVPAAFATKEGASFTSFPFGRSTPVRVQQAYAAAFFAKRKYSIARVALRPDGKRSLAKKGSDIEIFLGSAALSGQLDPSFAKNRGMDYVRVFTRRKISLPRVQAAPGPRKFLLDFALDRRFVFDARTAGLLIEFVVHGQQSGRWEVDLDSNCRSARKNFGLPGCKSSNGLVPLADCPTAALVPGAPFVLRVARLRPQDLAVGVIGSRESGMWSGLSLPAKLDRFGARGCSLSTDVVVANAGVVNALGELRLRGRVPALPGLVGSWLRFQGFALDARANALGMSFSNAHKIQVCARPPMNRLVATKLSASLGSLELGIAPILRLQE